MEDAPVFNFPDSNGVDQKMLLTEQKFDVSVTKLALANKRLAQLYEKKRNYYQDLKEEISEKKHDKANKKESAHQELVRRVCGMEDMCTKLETLKEENEKLLQQKEQLEASLVKQDAIITKHTEKASQKSDSEKMLSKLEQTISVYQDLLGMECRKLSGDRLQLIMTNVTPSHPTKSYYFTVHVSDDGIYSILKMEPEIDSHQMKAMTSELNSTNNFRGFVIKFRDYMKQIT